MKRAWTGRAAALLVVYYPVRTWLGVSAEVQTRTPNKVPGASARVDDRAVGVVVMVVVRGWVGGVVLW